MPLLEVEGLVALTLVLVVKEEGSVESVGDGGRGRTNGDPALLSPRNPGACRTVRSNPSLST